MTVQRELTATLGDTLAPLGFRRRGSNWFRLGEELYSIVNVQASSWGNTLYVNIGFSLTDRVVGGWQPESNCVVRLGIDDLKRVPPKDLRLLSGDVYDRIGQAGWRVAVGERIAPPVAEAVATAKDLDGLRRLLQDYVSGGVMIHHDVRDLLGCD